MHKPLSLRKNFAWVFVGNTISMFCMWLLLVLLTKLAPPETVGLFAVARAIGLPISLLLSLKLGVVQLTDTKSDYYFGDYYALKIITSIVTIFVISIAGFVLYPLNTWLVITLLGMGYTIIAFRELFLVVMQKAERMDKMSISRIMQGLLSVGMFGSLFWLTNSLALGILGLIVARILVLYFYDVPVARKMLADKDIAPSNPNKKIIPSWQIGKLWKLTRLTIPLGLVAWLGSMFASTLCLVMDKFVGRKEVGYFAAISSLLVVGRMLISALGEAILPRLSKYYVSSPRAYKLLLLKFSGVALFIGVAGVVVSILFGKLILTLMFTAEYAEHSRVFIQLMVAGSVLLLFTCMNIGLTAARKFVVQVPIYAVAAGVCAVSAFLLIPAYGMIGAAWSLSICYFTGFAGCLLFVVLTLRKS